ncbi:MAG: hypothetical protein IMZ50_09680 [Candidatus Atribacteria bacterium]|nr:hypothetical protein [Candidatus Atribacteria bacterium]
MKEQFIDWNPGQKSLALLKHIATILELYRRQGYRLTLRQLYYQMVSRDLIPNNVRSYSSIGDLVSNGRLAGIIDWEMIEDRVRIPARNSHWESPAQILEAAASSYYRDRWEDQECHVEVWCEKDAVSNIIQPVCKKWDVTFMANRGYSSQSAMYEAYQRLRKAGNDGKENWIIYLGDHDPSGIDMTRDITERIGTFLAQSFEGVNRIALNMDQIDLYNPPENPAKQTDSRFASYLEKYGESSWELDALEPSILSDLVEKAILKHADISAMQAVEEIETEHKVKILDLAARLED